MTEQTIYVAIWEDRHSDASVHLFTHASTAVDWARKTAQECDRHGDYKETEIEGWLFYATYSCESDSIRVVQADLDADV